MWGPSRSNSSRVYRVFYPVFIVVNQNLALHRNRPYTAAYLLQTQLFLLLLKQYISFKSKTSSAGSATLGDTS